MFFVLSHNLKTDKSKLVNVSGANNLKTLMVPSLRSYWVALNWGRLFLMQAKIGLPDFHCFPVDAEPSWKNDPIGS
jgi:hypothetical protein